MNAIVAISRASIVFLLSARAAAVGLIGPCTSSDPPPPMPAASAPLAMPQGYSYSLAHCTAPIVGWSSGGAVLGWVCRDGTKVYSSAYAVRHGAITKEMADSFLAIPFAADPREATRAHFARFGTQHFLGMADVWCEPAGTDWRLRWNAALQAKLDEAKAAATAPQWISSGGAIYSVTAGVRRVLPGRTAPAGAGCDCSSPIVYLTFSFCPLLSGPPNEVTLCKRAP